MMGLGLLVPILVIVALAYAWGWLPPNQDRNLRLLEGLCSCLFPSRIPLPVPGC